MAEDDADALQVRSDLLEAGGDEVSVSCTGNAAIALARLDRPDVVVMDLRLPHTNGVQLIQTLKAADASTTIVAFSWLAGSVDATERTGGSCHTPSPAGR